MMAWAAFSMVKDRTTCGAALKLESPGCEALIVQVPDRSIVTEPPETVHTLVVSLEKLGARPDVAVALREKADVEKGASGSVAKAIVWAALSVVKDDEEESVLPVLFVA